MNQEIKIRNAHPDDALQLATLAIKNMSGYPFESIYDPSALALEIANSPSRIVAETNDGHIVGTAMLGDGHMAEIKRVLVDISYRGNGLGHQLTSTLKQMARAKGVIPHADVRADQIGMQRAAHRYDLKLIPTSLETGKHVVYSHPARETMVSFSGLELAHDTHNLVTLLKSWPKSLSQVLVANMIKSLQPRPANIRITRDSIPSAQFVKARITRKVQSTSHPYTQLGPDILKLTDSNADCLIITPDASAFVEGSDPRTISSMIETISSIGLQIITCYLAVANPDMVMRLTQAGMEVAMVRPWQQSPTTQPEWQVGMRKTANHFENSLHSINLDPDVKAGISQIISKIDKI